MSILTNSRRIIKAGFVNFWRNGVVSLSAIFVMTAALFVVGVTLLASVFFDSTLTQLRNKVDVNVYFNAQADEADILTFKKSIEALTEVEKTDYISRDQAIENFKSRHENDALMTQALDELVDNPLGAILNIKAKDPSEYQAIADYISKAQGSGDQVSQLIYSVNYARNKEVIDKLSQITNSVERVGFALMVFLMSIAILISFNTIRLAIYISREEIAIMRLVGANNSFVRGPFIIEGMMYGVVASIISTALLYPVTLWLRDATAGFFGGTDLFEYYLMHLNQIFGILIIVGVVLGSLSSILAVRKYLQV